jgi:hypothetical protein
MQAMLLGALANPFEGHEFHISRWYSAVVKHLPLAAFQAHYYARWQHGENPSTYPLPQFIRSIAEDESIVSKRHTLTSLEATLDDRRNRISNGAPVHVREIWTPGEPLCLYPSSPLFSTYPPDLAGYEVTDDDGGGGYVSPYEDVGRELVELVDNLKYALTKASRREASAQLRSFHNRLLGWDGPGRHPKFPNTDVLKALAGEFTNLLQLLRGICLPPAPAAVLIALSDAGATDGEYDLWRWRLALPILSRLELQVLDTKVMSCASGVSRAVYRRFAIQIMSHRLQVLPADLARRISGSEAAARLADVESPFRVRTPSGVSAADSDSSLDLDRRK